MSHYLYRLGRSAARHPWVVIGLWAIMAAAVVVASSSAGRELEDTVEVPGLDSQQAIDLLSAAQSDEAGLTAQVVATPTGGGVTFVDSASARDDLASLHRSLVELPNVVVVTDPAAALADGAAPGLVSPDGRVALLTIQYPVMEELSVDDLDRLKEWQADAGASTALQIELGGELPFAFEEPETGIGELIGLGVAVVVLLVAFGSVVAMGLPIGIALFGLGLGIAAMPLVSHLIEVPSWAPIIASMVGLGVGIDYALFLVTRHREYLAAGLSVTEAAGRAVATAGQAVVFAGGTVVVAILGLAVAGIPWVTAAGVAVSVVVLIMVAGSITLLPAFLGVAGGWINRIGLPLGRGRAIGQPGQWWPRWGNHVSRHALVYTVGVTAVLAALTAPVLSLRLGLPDAGTLPESSTERRAYDLVADGFGPGTNGPLIIAVDLALDEGGDPAVVDELWEAVAADPGVAQVAPPQIDPASGVATLLAVPTTAPQDQATSDTVDRLRAEVFPVVLDDEPAVAHVGGQTATMADLGDRVQDRLFLFIAAVVGLSFVLLTMVFRSLLVPLKAAILNLLSIGAAYGVLVMVFQWQWGASLIGLEGPVPIVSFIPMFMFAIVFGLSMDYEVFLLSRIRERYLATGDNQRSVIDGLAATGRVITSAALIMVSVFLGFVQASDPTTKMMGLGLATAILVDATVVRMVLVPATMKLLGDANWWLPGWLDRILPTIDIDGPDDELGGDGTPETDTDDRSERWSDEPLTVGAGSGGWS